MIEILSLFLTVFLLDLVSKAIVRATMTVGREIRLLPVFSLTHVKNTGTVFGLFQDANVVFIVIGLAITAGLAYLAVRLHREDPWGSRAMALILGGAVGNLVDRLVFGQVTDFLDFYIGTHHWYIFNIADSAICVGAGLLFLKSVRSKPADPAGDAPPAPER